MTINRDDLTLATLNGVGTFYRVALHPNDTYSLSVSSGPITKLIAADFTTFGAAVVAATALIENECAEEGWGEDLRFVTSTTPERVTFNDSDRNDMTVVVRMVDPEIAERAAALSAR